MQIIFYETLGQYGISCDILKHQGVNLELRHIQDVKTYNEAFGFQMKHS